MKTKIHLNINKGQLISFNIEKGNKKLDVGNKLSDFKIEKELGKGNFGSVYLVTSKLTNKEYAMKEIKSKRYKNEEERLNIQKELKLLENLDNPHVITYFSSFYEKGNLYIITEYINGGSLKELIQKLKEKGKLVDEKKMWEFLIQLLKGLFYLHEEKKIIHKDIKPENILIDEHMNLKISDYGINAINNKKVDDMLKHHGISIGSIQFIAPEMINNGIYDFKSDIYMLGLTLFNLMFGKLPDEKKLKNNKEKHTILYKNSNFPDYYSDQIKGFIKDLLTVNQSERPSAHGAFSGALSVYTLKYLNTNSILSALQCFYSITALKKYFNSDKIQEIVKNDEDKMKYLMTRTVKKAFNFINPNYFNYNEIKAQCLKLRLLFYSKEEKFLKMTEINIMKVLEDICNNLHKELNKNKSIKNESEPGINNLNEELINKKEENIDESNEKKVFESACKNYQEIYRSKISDLIYFLENTTHKCPNCNNKIKTKITFQIGYALYPERAAISLKQKKLSVYNLFQHVCKQRLFNCFNEFCKYCDKSLQNIIKIMNFYICPLNLILMFDYKNANDFVLEIEEFLDISDFVIRKDVNNPKYRLIGVIFSEKNEDGIKYFSYTKDGNQQWKYFNGKSYEDSNLNELQNHKNIEVLFYTSL